MMARSPKPDTVAAQAAGHESAAGGVVGAIELATTFVRDADYNPPSSGDVYRRPHSPTVREAEAVIAALEGAASVRLFASGLAAIATVMRAAGGGVALQQAVYHGTYTFAERFVAAGGRLARFDGTDLADLERAIAEVDARLVMIETPSNPYLSVIDITAAADLAHRHGARLAVDSTAATPVITRPIAFGADVVVHSASKALNGHSDVILGAVALADGDDAFAREIGEARHHEGAMPAPFDAWLLTRGMRTVVLRVRAQSANALAIAQFLETHPKVALVRYPGLPSHPRHTVARAQMTGGFGGLMSFDVAGGAPAALALAGKLRLIKRATSLGGVESLIEHRHSVEPPSTGIPPALLRLSVGIEAVDDLKEDLDRALAAI